MRRIIVDRGISIPVRDGTRLAADLYRPDIAGPLPTVLRRTPYGRGEPAAGASLDATRIVSAGYNLLVQDVRGRHGSGGRFEPYLSEAVDGADTIAWIAGQRWSNGRVFMIGRSYDGATQWLAAGASEAGNAGLTAIAPHMAASQFGEGWTYRSGAFQLGFCMHWVLDDLIRPELAQPDAADEVGAAIDGIEELYKQPARARELLARHAPYYTDWPNLAGDREYWAARAAGPPRPTTASLSIGGWYDIFADATIDAFRQARAAGGTHRLIVGPWSHCVRGGVFPQRRYGLAADEAAADITGEHLDFFALAADAELTPAAPVRLFIMGADQWHDFAAWPPPGTAQQTWYLHSLGGASRPGLPGTLNQDAPAEEPPDAFRADPDDPVPTVGGATLMAGMFVGADCGPLDQRVLDNRPDIARYLSDPLSRDLAVIGTVIAELFVSTSAADADVTARLIDVWPSGRAELICEGIMRGRYHADPRGGSPLIPGQVHQLTITLGATAMVFRAGHRLRLDLAGASFPRFDVNPNTGAVPGEDSGREVALTSIHHRAAIPSHLSLPILDSWPPL